MTQTNHKITGNASQLASITPSWPRYMIMWLVLLNMIVGGIISLSLYQSKSNYEDRAAVTTQNISQVLYENLTGVFDKVNIALTAVVNEAQRQLAEGSIQNASFSSYISRQHMHLPEVESFRATNAAGDAIYGAQVLPAKTISLAQRDYFELLRDDRNVDLVVSKPLVGGITGKKMIILARRINRPDGTFAGLVYAGITLEYLTKVFSRINIETHGTISLLDSDLKLVVRYMGEKPTENLVGQKVSTKEFIDLADSGKESGTYVATSSFDKIERVFAFRKLRLSSPYYINVGLAKPDFLAAWYIEVLIMSFAMLVFLGITILLNWLIIRDLTQRKWAEQEHLNNERRVTSLFEISQYPFSKEQEFLDHALNEVIGLTESKIGYIYFYSEEDRQFTLNSWSNEVMKECNIAEAQTLYNLDKTGIWGEAVRQRKPIMLNDFQAHHPLKKGVPEGHVQLKRFLTVPVFINEAIVAVVGVANKESDYNDSDIMQLTLFMDAVWKITENKRITEDKLALEKQLLHSQKLESLGIMAGGIAHDFNNLLQSILGNIELVGMRLDSDSKSKEYIKQAKMAGKKAAHLSSLMLTYAGNRFTDKRALNLNKLAAENSDIFQSATTAAVTIEMNLAEELPAIIADEAQLQQVVMNLITNAAESIVKQAGLIRITTGIQECDQSDMASN
ncbi:MAG: GAF domain-containing protein, partial [Deltaproteobacteria bacterium]